MRRSTERGSVVLTVALTIGLIAGGAVLLRMQLLSTRSTAVVTSGIDVLNCAESGVIAARPLLAANYAAWNTSLCNPAPPRGTGACVIDLPTAEPAWMASVPHDVDGDGTNDLVIAVVDNDDEVAMDPTRDADSTVYLIATCNLRGNRAQVSELVHYDSATGSLARRLWLRTE